MRSRRAVATCAALLTILTVGTRAWAQAAAVQNGPIQVVQPQSGFTEKFRFQAGTTRESRGDVDTSDFLLNATPEVSWVALQPGVLFRATYSLTGTVHTNQSSDVANRLSLNVTTEPTRRTQLTVNADGTQSTISSSLITNSAAQAPVNGVLTQTDTQTLTIGSGESLTFEATPRLRLGQTLGMTYSRGLDAASGIDNFAATGALSADRSWKSDSLGIETRGTFASTRPAPTITIPTPPRQKLFAITPAGRWRHDITTTLSSSAEAGPVFVFSPNANTRSTISIFGRGALSYFFAPATIDLTYTHTFEPNTLTGQVLRSHTVFLRGATPLSTENHIVGTTGIGYVHGAFTDLREDPIPRDDFNAFVGDVEIGWSPYDWMQPFARYQFLTQNGGASAVNDPAYVRHGVFVGIQFTNAPVGVAQSTGRPSQRVDRSDNTPAP